MGKLPGLLLRITTKSRFDYRSVSKRVIKSRSIFFISTPFVSSLCFVAGLSTSLAETNNPSTSTSQTKPSAASTDAPLNLERMQQEIQRLMSENEEIKRRQTELAKQLREQTELTTTAKDLAQDVDGQFRQSLKISGYADVEANMTKDSNYFRLHHFSLFFSKSIADRWHLFSEVEFEDAPLFEAENEKTTVLTPTGQTEVTQVDHASGAVFLEAMNLDFRWHESLSFRFGRFFTPAGIWSVDHYPPFVVTQERPLHIRRIFPQLIDGMEFYGKARMDSHWFNYDVYLGNGENNDQLMKDQDGNKSVGLRAAWELEWLQGVEWGISVYHDSQLLSPCSGNPVGKSAYGSHVKLQWSILLLQSEYALADYEHEDSADKCVSKGNYTQVGLKFNKSLIGWRTDKFDNKLEAEKRQASVFFNYRVQKDILFKVESHRLSQLEQETRWSIVSMAVNLGH